MAAVWELAVPLTDKMVLLGFADHADDSGFCYPSYARVAWKCGVSERTVARCVARFKGIGLVEVVSDAFAGRTQRLRIRADKGAKLSPFRIEGSTFTTEKAATQGFKVATAMSPEPSVVTINEPYGSKYFSHPKYGEMRRKRFELEHGLRAKGA